MKDYSVEVDVNGKLAVVGVTAENEEEAERNAIEFFVSNGEAEQDIIVLEVTKK